MAEAALVRPLREAHLADEPGLDPVMALASRGADIEGGGGAAGGWQRLPDPTEGGRVEARTHFGDVDEAGPVVETDVERTEVAARALRVGVAADDELLALLTLQLDPIRRPPADVPAPRALRDDALEPGALRGPIDVEPRLRHVVASPHRAARREEAS